MSNTCKKSNCKNTPDGMNGYCHSCTEEGLENLLNRLREEPHAKEREELGFMMMKHIDTFSKKEMERYNELKQILKIQ